MSEQAREWEKPLVEWTRIFEETPDYDCWPAPIRGWEVGTLVRRLNALERALKVTTDTLESIKTRAARVIENEPDHGGWFPQNAYAIADSALRESEKKLA